MHFEIIPGATGYIDTNYEAKAAATIKMFDKYDFVLTHINATDEAAHMHDIAQKIAAIENVDRYILEPVFCHLKKYFRNNFAVIVCGDHKTRCCDGKHIGDPVPFLFYLDNKALKQVRKLFKENPVPCRSVLSLQFIKEAIDGYSQDER